MSKNVAVFIDVANLYYAARGQDVDVDYVALLKYATKGRDLIRAYAYSGLDPENENQRKFLDFLSKNGYKVVHKDIRKFGDGRVKANLDIELVVDLFRLAPRMDYAVIVSGDGDFASAIRALQDIGVRCEVISFRPNTSSDLIAVADEFTDIMKIIGIGRKKGEKGISMPEMPAKEVNPEFGFREASRGVAAAALAALREGGTPAPRTRRGRRPAAGVPMETVGAGVDVPTPSAEVEPVEPMTALEAHLDGVEGEPSKRRRRRRGGRGRGRGRRPETQADTVQEAEGPDGVAGELGWQEFDDLSQVGLTDLGQPGEEREYSFEEADPQTLAELGIVADGPGEARDEAASEGEIPPPVTKGRGRGTAGLTGAARGGRRRAVELPVRATPLGGEPSADQANAEPGGKDEAAVGARPAARGKPAATRARPARRRTAPETAPAADAARPRRGRQPSASSTTAADAASASATRTPTSRRGASGRARAQGSASIGSPAEGSAPDASTGGEGPPPGEEGIWQRFRSGRRTTRSAG